MTGGITMHHRNRFLSLTALAALAAIAAGAPALADDAASAKDLTATIALNGMPCGQVVSVKTNADSDYTATCKDGNRYHVFVNSQGRVIVQKL
jgi:hypothetical protein